MRRKRISSRPCFESKYHFPFCLTMGTGSGQSSLPTERIARFWFFAIYGHQILLVSLGSKSGSNALVTNRVCRGNEVLAIRTQNLEQDGNVIAFRCLDQSFGRLLRIVKRLWRSLCGPFLPAVFVR